MEAKGKPMFFAHLGSDPDTLVPLVVIPLVTLVVLRRRRGKAVLLAIAAGALAFQVVHALEHGLQAGYWVAHPTSPAWLTPWAEAGRDVLATVSDGRPSTGVELLHLAGNAIFLVGLFALAAPKLHSLGLARPALRRSIMIQSAHVLEHVALTLSVVLGSAPIGVTTLFGLLPPTSTVGVGVRVWSHFLINAGATWYAIAAVRPVIREAHQHRGEAESPRKRLINRVRPVQSAVERPQ